MGPEPARGNGDNCPEQQLRLLEVFLSRLGSIYNGQEWMMMCKVALGEDRHQLSLRKCVALRVKAHIVNSSSISSTESAMFPNARGRGSG